MKTELFKNEILVQQYKFGEPFPDLYAELDGLARLPKKSRVMESLEGGMSGKFGVVLTRTQGFVLVADGAYMQISKPAGGLNLPICIGRVPQDYVPK